MALPRIATLQAVLFATGAVTLSLELVASRILTPLFGSSLYVWTGILAVTLCCLAAGYDIGGRWSRREGSERIGQRYALLPLAAAGYLLAVTLLHPLLLDGLHAMDVVLGALAGCVLLLGPVLVALSAMNPLLSALAGGGRDGGGRAFAVSTAGSVGGVLFTSFALVPAFPAPDILLILGGTLACFAAAAALATVRPGPRGRIVLGSCLLLAALAAAALLPRTDQASIGPFRAERLATYRSAFGDIHVVEAGVLGTPVMRLYIQNGGLQGGIDARGRSVTAYADIVRHALLAARPEARHVLVIGLGAGILPRDLAHAGMRIEVFEIDRVGVEAARRHFGLPSQDVEIRIGDGRILVGGCRRDGAAFDAIILDAFSGIEIPWHLLTVEFFAELRGCLAPDGVVLGNLVLPGEGTPLSRAVLATAAAGLGGDLTVYRRDRDAPPDRYRTLVFLAGSRAARSLQIEDFPVSPGARGPAVIEGSAVRRNDLVGADILTDRRNRYDWLAAGQAAARRQITVTLPPYW